MPTPHVSKIEIFPSKIWWSSMSSPLPLHPRTGELIPEDGSKAVTPDDSFVDKAPDLTPLTPIFASGPPLRTESLLGNWILKVLGVRKKTEQSTTSTL